MLFLLTKIYMIYVLPVYETLCDCRPSNFVKARRMPTLLFAQDDRKEES